MESTDADVMEEDIDSASMSRPSTPYVQVRLEEHKKPTTSTRELLLQKTKGLCTCTPKTVARSFLKLFPVIEWFPRYKIKEQLLGDIVSGLIVGIVTIPQTIAYSFLANQDPIYGLYTNFFCFLIYIAFATSRHNCVGADGVLCLMIGETVSRHLMAAGYNADTGGSSGSFMNSSLAANGTIFCDKSCYAIKIATSLTFLVGVYQVIFWIFKLGFITMYLSEPLLSGFVTGGSLMILTSQVKYLFGLKLPSRVGSGAMVLTWIDIFIHIKETNICDLITSIVAFAFLIPIKELNERFKHKLKVPLPMELVVLVVAILVSHFFDFKGKYNSSICGKIPTGFLHPVAPDFSIFADLAVDAFPIAVISFVMTVSLAEIFGKKHGYAVRANQEMLAVGICNFITSFLHSFTSSAALAKTIVRDSTGSKTQVSGIISALVLLLVLLVIAPLFYSLQTCILGVIMITNLRGALRKFADMPNMWRLSKIDTVIWWVSMLASFLITIQIGLLVAVCFSILCIIFHTQRPRATLLAKVKDCDIYEDQFTYRELRDNPTIKIFRFDASLYYANQSYFKDMLYRKTEVNPIMVANLQRKAKKAQGPTVTPNNNVLLSRFGHKKPVQCSMPKFSMSYLIIDCCAMQFIDTVGLSVLKEIQQDYQAIGVHVYLANCSPSMRRSLQDGGYCSHVGEDSDPKHLSFHSVHNAVQFAEKKIMETQKDSQPNNTVFGFDPSRVTTEEYGMPIKNMGSQNKL